MVQGPKFQPHPSWVLAFALAMLLAQSLGLLHRAAGQVTRADTHAGAHYLDIDHQGHGSNLLGKLFAGHASDADCQTFDQLSHFDSASALLAQGLSLAMTSALCTLFKGLGCARWHAQFQARGPPISR